MRLDRTNRTWERLACADPIRAIVDGADGDSLEAFLATGVNEVAGMFAALQGNGLEPRYDSALDFGCGLGRLSLPLCSRFERVTGVDASDTMVRRARELAAEQAVTNIDFRVGKAGRIDLTTASQDFVLSLITLQHIPAPAQARYVTEFARVLAPGGIAVIQIITGHALEPTSWLRRQYRRALPQHWRSGMRRSLRPRQAVPDMYCLSHSELLETIAAAGAETVADLPDRSAPGWVSRRLVLRR